jgi:aerobic carbon-monoxide dehydrogenase medium subunit
LLTRFWGRYVVILSEAEFHEASTLEQAAELMACWGAQARFLAGGTGLVVDLKTDRYRLGHVISINRIAGLRGISPADGGVRIGALTTVGAGLLTAARADGGVRIGALTTLNQLATSTVIGQRFPALVEAAREMASPQIRNLGTVGGNIVGAVPCADLPPVLTVMHAAVSLWSAKGQRVIPIETFFVGPRQTVLRDDEILTEIFIPDPQARFGAGYARFGLREANSVAVAAVAAGLVLREDGTVGEARICLNAVASTPKMVAAAESLLVGRAVDEAALDRAAAAAMEASQPISDLRGTADYRRDLVGILTRRALVTAHKRATGGKQ